MKSRNALIKRHYFLINTMDSKIILFILSVVIGKTTGNLRCYACSFSSSDSDQSCLYINDNTNTVECQYTYCTILRQEFLDPSGVVASFTRGCESQPDYLNHEVTDFTYRTYYRACTSDLCNIGDGVQSIVGGNLSPSPMYNGENLLVPGTADNGNGASQSIKISVSLMILCLVGLFI